MSNVANELKEVKSIIRGLLISSTTTTSIRRLESDYRNQEGCDIPFKMLGFSSIEAFLRSIPDTVRLREPQYGCPASMIIVEPIQSVKSTHVDKMVVRQKNSKIMRCPKRASAIPDNCLQNRSRTSNLNGMAPGFVPMALRVSLNRVCQRHALNGLPFSLLGNELSRDLSMAGWCQEGKAGWLASHGFSSVNEVIDAFIDQGLIKVSVKNGIHWITYSNDKQLGMHMTSYTAQNNSYGEIQSSSYENFKTESDLVSSKPYSGMVGHITPAGLEPSSDEELFEVLISDAMKKNFRSILNKHPDGLWCSSLPYEYKKLTGYELDVKQLGFVSVIQMASKLRDVFICSRPDSNSDWLLFDSKSNSIWNSPAAPSCKERKWAALPSHVVTNIEELLEAFPSGILRHKFLDSYKEKYHEDLHVADLGFENIMALLAHLAQRNIIHLKFSGTAPMVCSPLTHEMKENSFQELTKDNDFISALYPQGVMRPPDDIPIQPFSENFSCGCSIDILVTEVATPSLFWFQLWGTDIQREFNTMMDDIQQFYNLGDPSVHKMPDATILVGQFCAARYPPEPIACGEWHRARITSLPSFTEVEVFYVDYGSKAKALRSEIRFLDLRFSHLPLQAHKAALVNIRPIGYGLWKQRRNLASSWEITKIKPMWSREACSKFLGMVTNQPSVAIVAHIRDSDNLLSVALIDTSKENDIHINDLLVYGKLAEFGDITDEEDDLTCNGQTLHYKESGNYSQGTEKSTLQPTFPGLVTTVPRPITQELRDKSNLSQECQLPYFPEFSRIDSQVPNKDTNTPKLEEYFVQIKDEKRQQEDLKVEEILEAKRVEESKHLEEKAMKIEEILEAKRVEESKHLEEKAIQEAKLQLELEKVKLHQQQLQYQWFQTQLLILATQNCMMPNVPPGLDLFHQAMLPPPPGLSKIQPFANTQDNIAGLFPRAMQNNSLSADITRPLSGNSSFAYGNVPFIDYLSLLGAAEFSKTTSIGSGESHSSGSNLYSPPGFESNAKAIIPPTDVIGTTPNITSLSAGNSYKGGITCSVGEQSSPLRTLGPHYQLSQGSTDSVTNNISQSPKTFAPNIYIATSEINRNDGAQDKVTLQTVYDINKNFGNCKYPETKLEIYEAASDLSSSLEAWSISSVGESKSSSSVTDNTGSKKSYSKDVVALRSTKENWIINMEDKSTEDNSDISKGTLNGKSVHLIKVGACYYVLTEEILALFFNNLPVHVALKIAEMRPNGDKIDCISINPKKHKNLYKSIERLGAIEGNLHGADIHLTSVETLYFLCSALGNSG